MKYPLLLSTQYLIFVETKQHNMTHTDILNLFHARLAELENAIRKANTRTEAEQLIIRYTEIIYMRGKLITAEADRKVNARENMKRLARLAEQQNLEIDLSCLMSANSKYIFTTNSDS